MKTLECGNVRLLSYNMNMLPRGASGGAFQEERIQTFVSRVKNEHYDLVVLQEAFAAALLPYVAQRLLCFQRRIVDELEKIGFKHCALPRQPQYSSILRFGMTTDTGLVILSRLPIVCHGSFTFRSSKHGEQRALKGCLYAKLRTPGTELLIFNVYLRNSAEKVSPTHELPKESDSAFDQPVSQLCNFIHTVLEQHGGCHCPFVLAGNLGSNNKAELIRCLKKSTAVDGDLHDVMVTENTEKSLPTKPPRLFFQSRIEWCPLDHSDPQCHDYVFLGNTANRSLVSRRAKLEKFHAPPLRPYLYLSDHFGISVEIEGSLEHSLPACLHPSRCHRAEMWKASMNFSEWLSQQMPDRSPYTLWGAELLLMAVITAASLFFVPLSEVVLPVVALLFSMKWLLGNTVLSEGLATAMSAALNASGTQSVCESINEKSDETTPPVSVWSLWEEAASKHKWSRCLGQRCLDAGILFDPEWLTFSQCDTKVRGFGSGLLLGCCSRGDTVGVMCGSNRRAALVDIACLGYGLTTLSLAGSQGMLRQVLDSRNIQTVVCGKSCLINLLECRSRSLRTVITIQPTEYDEEALAKDLNVELIKFETIEGRGRKNPCTPCPLSGAEAPFTFVMESGENNAVETTLLSQHDVLRTVDSLRRTGILKMSSDTKELYVWHAPFSSLFHRLFTLAMMLNGDAVACAESMRLNDALKYFQPTILVAPPSLFYNSELQFRDNLRKRNWISRFLFTRLYQFRSHLIHERGRDSSTLRRLFFRTFQRQIGGRVRRLVVNSTDTSLSYHLHEFIAVCYTTCIREVFFSQKSGVFVVDGAPAPYALVQLQSLMDTTEVLRDESIGKLSVAMKSLYSPGIRGPFCSFDIAAAWIVSDTHSTPRLQLLGPSDAILWPVYYLYACAQELEREFAQCRYVFDVFVTCEVGKPLVAVVHPNKELIDWEWCNRHDRMASRQLSWPELVAFGAPLIVEEFQRIASERGVHVSQRIAAVHMHPHAFSEHNDFLNPHGKLRRSRLSEYFYRHVQKLYGIQERSATTIESPVGLSKDLSFVIPKQQFGIPLEPQLHSMSRQWRLTVPVSVDIGGTFAKVMYLKPPGTVGLPSFVQRDYSLLERTMTPNVSFFRDDIVLEANGQQNIGELCFAKFESKLVPEFVKFLSDTRAIQSYKPEYVVDVRATGGGAFKYANLIRSQLGVNLKIVKEMDSIVAGLNLLLQIAPETIFAVDADSGAPVPHKLHDDANPEELQPYPFLIVNMGSGVSIVKCTSNSGDYERVGGSAIGGATFWGLVRTMTHIQTWDEVMEITRVDGPGDNTNVDLLVGDIYGFNARELPALLSVDTVASTFGKLGTDRFSRSLHVRRPSLALSDDDGMAQYETNSIDHTEGLFPNASLIADDFHPPRPPSTVAAMASMRRAQSTSAVSPVPPLHHSQRDNVASIDIVRSLLIMIANNVTQLAYLHCKSEATRHVFFTGGFVRDNPIVWKQVARSMRYWSQGGLHAHFLAHDGYLGALGTSVMDISTSKE